MKLVLARMLLFGVFLWLVSACANSEPAGGAMPAATSAALKPAPLQTPELGLPSPSSDIARPPTGTPTSLPTSTLEPDTVDQVPTATTPPQVTARATPIANQVQPTRTIEPASLVAGMDCAAEIENYRDLLDTGADLPAFQAPLVAGCLAEAGDSEAAVAVYQGALESALDRLAEVTIRQGLGDLLFENGDYLAALAQYEAILSVAETETSRGRALYQAGQAESLAGNQEAGYARLLTLVARYPEAPQSYAALTLLLSAGYEIDDVQQGVIAYNAGAYGAAAAAFSQAVEASPNSTMETHLHLAWSLEKLGDVDGALARLDAFIAAREAPPGGAGVNLAEAARGRIERAKVNYRTGRTQAALDDYQTYLSLYPQGADAHVAAWHSASLVEALGSLSVARDRYLAFSQSYPENADAAQAMFRAGYLSWELGDADEAQTIWGQAVGAYPERDYGAASLLWLLKTLPVRERAEYEARALNGDGLGYYAPRAAHVASGIRPFASTGSADLKTGDAGRAFAESWLRQWLGLAPDVPVGELSDELAADPRLAWAERLWSSGATAEAARQFEILRADYAGDALASYQLALYFRDLGLYKSSVLAALSLMDLAGVGASGAPRFIARLAYPAYYADLVTAAAQRYDYDPLLQLALIREESYFDAMATSPLGAQGLSQILPETSAHIADQLGWPGYDDGTPYQPEAAIAFGAYYLDQLLDRYDANVAAALAAYNAGPGFADDWVKLEADDFDRFLETIDFPETQRFIKQLYITHAIYRFLYT